MGIENLEGGRTVERKVMRAPNFPLQGPHQTNESYQQEIEKYLERLDDYNKAKSDNQ